MWRAGGPRSVTAIGLPNPAASSGIIRSSKTALPPGNQPQPEYEQLPNGEKRPKDCLIASGQPKRQIDVEVIRALLCVATCQISQRATAPVHREDRALDQYQPGQDGRP